MVADLTPAKDADPAEWIVESLTTFGKNVTGLLPSGFPAYVRVFHPAYLLGEGPRPWDTRRPVSWSAIAKANRKQAHAEMQLGSITGELRYQQSGQPDVYDRAPIFHIPARGYFLFSGTVHDAGKSGAGQRHQPANLWWSDDHAWCVHTEIDLITTYVACSAACRDDLLGRQELEAFDIDPAAEIHWLSDKVNPEPSRTPPDPAV